MYCMIVTGVPASGKTSMSEYIADELDCLLISKDKIKEMMFDTIGFKSRAEKVQLGVSSMEIMYYVAGQCMKHQQLFIMENNFENSSKEGLMKILKKYDYTAITIRLTGDYKVLYKRFADRELNPERHFGHVTNTCYPPKENVKEDIKRLSYEGYIDAINKRGMDQFVADGPCIEIDTTDFSKVDKQQMISQIKEIMHED